MNTQFGLPLDADVTQSLVPVITKANFNIVGYFMITSSTFDEGSVTADLTMPGTAIPLKLTSVRMPKQIDDGRGYGTPEFMAAVYDYVQAVDQPWLGFQGFVPITKDSGYSFLNPTSSGTYWRHRRGNVEQFLQVNPNGVNAVSPAPSAPDVSDPTGDPQRWVAGVAVHEFVNNSFFDFNWLEVFKAKAEHNNPVLNTIEPLRLTVESNPNATLRAMLVTGAGLPVVAGGGIQFNTIRIMALDTPAIDDYEFTFKVSNVEGLSTEVTFVLSIT